MHSLTLMDDQVLFSDYETADQGKIMKCENNWASVCRQHDILRMIWFGRFVTTWWTDTLVGGMPFRLSTKLAQSGSLGLQIIYVFVVHFCGEFEGSAGQDRLSSPYQGNPQHQLSLVGMVNLPTTISWQEDLHLHHTPLSRLLHQLPILYWHWPAPLYVAHPCPPQSISCQYGIDLHLMISHQYDLLIDLP